MHTFILLQVVLVFAATTGARHDHYDIQATSAALPLGEDASAEAVIAHGHPIPYIVPHPGTGMYEKTRPSGPSFTPPCTTTSATNITGSARPTPWFEKKIGSTTVRDETTTEKDPTWKLNSLAVAAATAATTTTATGAAIPLRAPKALHDIANFLGLKRKSKQPQRNIDPAPIYERSSFQLNEKQYIGEIVAPLGNIQPQLGEASLPAGNEESNPQRKYALGLATSNYEQLVTGSIAAVSQGGAANLVNMWAGFITGGNPYEIYYLNNGHGSPRIASSNELAVLNNLGVTSSGLVGGLLGGAKDAAAALPGNIAQDAGPALLSMMGQVYSTTYSAVSTTAGTKSSSASSTGTISAKASSTGSSAKASSTGSSAKTSSTRSSAKSTSTGSSAKSTSSSS